MSYSPRSDEQRQEQRVEVNLPAKISVGSQLTLQGQLKDISAKSAFIRIKNSIFLEINDEVGFAVQRAANATEDFILGLARISRIVPGEGFAVYFTKLDDASQAHLKELLNNPDSGRPR